jgi:hypothetical protein
MRNLPNMDMTDSKNIESARQAEAPSAGVSGKYEVEIVQASLYESKNGSVFLTLGFKMPNGKIYRQDPKHIMGADGKEGYYVPRLRTLFGVTGASDKIGTTTIKSGDFVDGTFVEKDDEVPSYVDLIGKKLGAVLRFYQKYPDSMGINGYTGHRIPVKAEDPEGYESMKAEATTIWMPNYESEPKPVFEFGHFFDWSTGKTYAELLDDNLEEPVEADEALEKIMKKDYKPVVLEGKEWDKLRINRLKRSLKKAGLAYDDDLFEPSATDTDDEEVELP